MWTPTLLPCPALQDGDAFTSGRINTKAHAGFYPGMQLEDGTTFASLHVEARMQLPTPGQGLWPAFWMFPTEPTYGEWAASGEVRAGGLAGCSSWRVQQLAGAKPACRGWRPPSMLPGAGCGCPAAAACTAPSSLVLAPVSPAPLSACPAALDQIDVMESINEMTTITQGLQYGGTGEARRRGRQACGRDAAGRSGARAAGHRAALAPLRPALRLPGRARGPTASRHSVHALRCHTPRLHASRVLPRAAPPPRRSPREPEEHAAHAAGGQGALLGWLPHHGCGLERRQDHA